MPEVKSRKTVFVTGNLTTGGTFTHNFRIGFDVDDMILLNWTCHDTVSGVAGAGGDGLKLIHLDGVGDLFAFFHQESVTVRTPFRIGKSMDGIQSFRVKDAIGATETGISNISVAFCVEFLEYYRD